MKRLVFPAALLALAAPALAQSGFFIVQDTTTKKCTVVKPRVLLRRSSCVLLASV
jgi:hypothetical protein